MFETVFKRKELAVGVCPDALNELFAGSEYPMGTVGRTPWGFSATVRTADLGQVNVAELSLSSPEAMRTPKLVRRADPELCCVIVPLNGEIAVSQAGKEVVLEAPDLAVYDSSRPFRIRITPTGGHSRLVRARVPRALLRLSSAEVERALARPVSGRTGFAAVLAQLLADATGDAPGYRPADLPRLGTLALELLTAVVAHQLDADAAVPDDSRPHLLLPRIERFIQQHLGNPELSPGTVAAAHHISVGHLHRLFLTRDTTVAAWIRHQRLDRARRDLADATLHGMPVHRIAARWGFKDHATFTRAFRSAFGVTPTEYRTTRRGVSR